MIRSLLNITKQRKKIKVVLVVTSFLVMRINQFYWSYLSVLKLLKLLSYSDFKYLSIDKLIPAA